MRAKILWDLRGQEWTEGTVAQRNVAVISSIRGEGVCA